MGVEDSLTAVSLLFMLISFLINPVGIYVLVVKSKPRTNQDIILLSYSIVDEILIVVDIVLVSFVMNNQLDNPRLRYVRSFHDSILVVWYLIIVILTLDRFLEVHLNIKYTLYFSNKKAKLAIATVCILGIAIMAGNSLIWYIFEPKSMSEIWHFYIFPTLDGLFFVIAILTYGYIYHQFRKMLKKDMKKAVRKTTFYVPSLVIVNFLVFLVVPDFIRISINIQKHSDPKLQFAITHLLYPVCNILNVNIYIFLNRTHRKILRRKIRVGLDRHISQTQFRTCTISKTKRNLSKSSDPSTSFDSSLQIEDSKATKPSTMLVRQISCENVDQQEFDKICV